MKKIEFLEKMKEFNPAYDLDFIGKAYDVANEMHAGQIRKSGEPYLVHPVCVAEILAELGMDEETIAAGLLHDVIEDTSYSKEDMIREFGEEVAALVDGVTKLGALKFESKEERQAENLRKMFLAMSKDIRVLIIKLSDRLHNLRTINYMTHEKIVEKCQETLDIYAPLAARLGIYTMKMELEDIALKFLEPEAYYDLAEQVSERKGEREDAINSVVEEIRGALNEIGIKHEIYGRSKHFYSIFKKMKYQHKNLDEIFDLMAVRIIVETVRDCYAVLGMVHTMWKPIPGRFKDYIAMPKPNMYQSLHTTVIGNYGKPFEIQIRTYEMHRIAEYGIAAHWKYKEGIDSDKEEVKLSWLRQALEWQKDVKDPKEFMESLKMDLFSNQVFVFTPNGDVIELPAGATPLDFAFKIHTDVGCKCVGAKVNGKMVTIDHELENGNIIEIVTSANAAGPSIDWLKIARSSSARNKIRQWLKKENRNDAVDKGKDLFTQYLRKKGFDPKVLLTNSYIGRAVKELHFKDAEDMYTQLSYGGNIQTKVAHLLQSFEDEKQHLASEEKNKSLLDDLNVISEKTSRRLEKKRADSETGVVVEGVDNLMIRLAKCCTPVPGDEITGYITKGRGITVHRKDCDNIKTLPKEERNRCIDVSWDPELLNKSFEGEICIIAKEQKGMLSSISKVCEDNNVDIIGLNGRATKDETFRIDLILGISDRSQIEKLCRSFKSIPGIMEAYRGKG
ncbi:MAG: bifunctional (p)ppGpp synthetase/guanosine-3',5'-bis(diphosphate) 3'-pyrophosphohydrolase [Bacillota bacterium]|nr:bifunctional (p)ppGpp synthetase/guanosine-3',5'-bis(diphosphate) 3'-pyrophosphohydrolase [Clostridiales bacterium]MDD6764533.1 bifunctional (p)ppGpp synthetase/guanosine-3',5'-bis(diphosphate) 3'-pyrophosphohydrolase [Bacillota bacterium]MDO4471570.1 bifunctional (p)ppGpp synthetase/guanosine-3',5'-bis(diphosphate) 3'-pyrophosphohydrolase [Bacillota bacterium]MDY5607469.1 bifunctional (p)ppGpp synthetase/guanosine-3',5'-bis(diphosphate) 3'-pyrophosphohydrolase [Lentihominibacter sp.]